MRREATARSRAVPLGPLLALLSSACTCEGADQRGDAGTGADAGSDADVDTDTDVDTDVDTDSDTGTDSDTATIDDDRHAYFILQDADLSGDGWPDAFAQYDVFVVNPSFPADRVATIHEDVPGAVALAYTNAQDIQIGMYAGNPYFDDLTDAFDDAWTLHDLDTGEIIKLYDPDPEGHPERAVPSWIPQPESVEALVAFHRDRTMTAGWDGIYVDMCTRAFSPWREARLLEITDRFDIDWDGEADDVEKLRNTYAAGRALLTARLREELGDAVVLVGNSAGALDDPALNGITIEGAGDRFTYAETRASLEDQLAVSREPPLSVLWVTSPAAEEVSARLARELWWVYLGDL